MKLVCKGRNRMCNGCSHNRVHEKNEACEGPCMRPCEPVKETDRLRLVKEECVNKDDKL